MQDQIKELEEEIEADKSAIKAKKLIVAALKKEQVKKVPFSKTKLGSVWYRTVRTITTPFARLHNNAKGHIEHPFVMQAEDYTKRAIELVDECVDFSRDKDEKKASNMSVKVATFVMELEDFCAEHSVFEKDLNELLKELRDQVERLRPPGDPDRVTGLKNMIDTAVSSFVSNG